VAQGNVDLKRGELKQTRGDTVYDTKRAYYGYLTARDIRIFLEDMQGRLDQAIDSVERNLKEETGESRQTDPARCKPQKACWPSTCTSRARSKKTASMV
jgi:outer membrane protein TolC